MAIKYSFKLCPADDDSMDDEYMLFADGKNTFISVQDCRSYGGGYGVNSYKGDHSEVLMHSSYPSYAKAKEAAIEVHKSKRSLIQRDESAKPITATEWARRNMA